MKIVIVEDDPMLRVAMSAALTALGVEIAGTAETASDAVALIDEHRPEVVTLDLRLAKENPPDDAGLRIAERVRAAHPDVGLLVLATAPRVEHVRRLMALQPPDAIGLLAKSSLGHMGRITDALDQLAKGQVVIDPEWVRDLLSPQVDADGVRPAPLKALTPRELQTLALIARGLTNEGIAGKLGCASGTVEKNVSAVFAKLGLYSAADDENINRRVVAAVMYLHAVNHRWR